MKYTCKYCGKEFESSAKLNGHVTFCRENPSEQIQYTCKYCGKVVIGSQRIKKHELFCKANPDYAQKNMNHNKNNTSDVELHCCYCGKLCKNTNSLHQHEIRCRNNPDKIEVNNTIGVKGRTPWNKGLTKETSEIIRKQSLERIEYFKTHPGTFLGKSHTEEAKQKIAQKQLELNHGNNPRRSHGKAGWYDGIYFMSRYEIAYYIYMRDTGHDIKRCDKSFVYFWDNSEHHYTPDFVVDENIVELKGFEHPADLAKYEAVPNLIVLYYDDIKHCFKYVKEKYNVKDVIELYSPVA